MNTVRSHCKYILEKETVNKYVCKRNAQSLTVRDKGQGRQPSNNNKDKTTDTVKQSNDNEREKEGKAVVKNGCSHSDCWYKGLKEEGIRKIESGLREKSPMRKEDGTERTRRVVIRSTKRPFVKELD